MIRSVLIFLFLTTSLAWSVNQTQDFSEFPINSTTPSSALIHDSSSLLLNPAMLARMDRMNMVFVLGNNLSIRYLSLGMLIPNAGALSGGIFRFGGTNKGAEGIMLGWGSDISPFFSLGVSLYTISDHYTRYNDGLLLNIGSIITFNQALGDAFMADWINNRLTFSTVFQNMGKEPLSTADTEHFTPRLGLAYHTPVIPLDLFVEMLPATPKQVIFGFKAHDPFFNLFDLSLSSDTVETHLGISLKSQDFSLDLSYEFKNSQFNLGFSAYFNDDRLIRANKLFTESTNYFNQALAYEQNDQETTIGKVFENYNLSLESIKKSIFFDPNKFQAQEEKENIQSKLIALRQNFIQKGESNLKKGHDVSALVFYQRARLIKSDSSLQTKIDLLSTNASVVKFITARKESINESTNKQDYISAKEEWIKLSWLFPKDAKIQQQMRQTEKKIAKQAEKNYQKANRTFKKGNYSATAQILQDTIAIFDQKQAIPQNNTYKKCLYLYYQVRKKTKGLKSLKTAREAFKNKNYVSALYRVNRILRKQKDLPSALRLKKQILAALNKNASEYYQKGVNAYNDGKYQQALDAFRPLLLIEDPNADVRDFQNRALDYQKRAKSKLKAIQQLESINQ